MTEKSFQKINVDDSHLTNLPFPHFKNLEIFALLTVSCLSYSVRADVTVYFFCHPLLLLPCFFMCTLNGIWTEKNLSREGCFSAATTMWIIIFRIPQANGPRILIHVFPNSKRIELHVWYLDYDYVVILFSFQKKKRNL